MGNSGGLPRGNADRFARTRVLRADLVEVVKDVLCAAGSPESQKVMVGIRQCAAASCGDQARIALCGENHPRHLDLLRQTRT
jgi:hypothetical protein